MTAPTPAVDPPPGESSGHFRRWVTAAAVLGFVLRVLWGRWVSHPPQGLYDPARYVGYARAIAAGQGMIEPLSGYPTAYYPPGYPWFLGIVTWLGSPLTDDVALLAAMVQAVLGSLTVVLGALVGRRIAGRRAGVVAAFALALYPNLIFHSGAVMGETLYNFLFLAFCAVAVATQWPRDLTGRRMVAAGLLLGLAVMVRPISLAVIPVVLFTWWRVQPNRRRLAAHSAMFLAAVAACILPWTIRNQIRMGGFVAISTNTGDNLCIGHADGATGSFGASDACITKYNFLNGPNDEIAADHAKTDTALKAILASPGREPRLVWRRFWFMWVRDGDHDGLLAVQSYRFDRFIGAPTDTRLAYAADVTYWMVCITGVAGAVTLIRRRHPEDLFLVGCAVMTALVPLAFFGDSRFKVPVIPLLIIMAATLFGDHRRHEVRDEGGASR